MPSIEDYIGSLIQNPQTGLWDCALDVDIQTNLNSICELVLMIFDAQTCLVSAQYRQGSAVLAQRGKAIDTMDGVLSDFKDSNHLQEVTLDDKARNSQGKGNLAPRRYRIVSPIVFPSGLRFGLLVFDRNSEQPLTEKEKAILQVLQRDINNHLLQNKQAFEKAKSNEWQTLISQHNSDWIFVKDEQFRIVYANNAFLRVYPDDMQDKIIGYTTVEEYEDADAEVFLAQDKIAFAQGISAVTEDLHMPDGRHMIVETVKRRFKDEHDKAYILCICRDITDKEDLIRELKKANVELDDFTSIASHDLKSPLNAIKRLLEWIEEDCAPLLPDEHVENLQLVVDRANRMQVLLDDLLRYAKIGRSDDTITCVNLTDVYRDISQLLDIPETVTVNVPDENLNVPALPFKTVMLNLIGNAIKHNDKSQGIVDVVLIPSRHYYVIEITDNGPGIEPRYFDRIFQLFQTLRSRDEVEGSGIGLSVVAKHINHFGGKIDVSSDGKSGSTFRFHWPKKGK